MGRKKEATRLGQTHMVPLIDLVKEQLGNNCTIVHTYSELDGMLIVYRVDGPIPSERAAFYTKGTIDNKPAVMCVWDKSCS